MLISVRPKARRSSSGHTLDRLTDGRSDSFIWQLLRRLLAVVDGVIDVAQEHKRLVDVARFGVWCTSGAS